MVSKWKQESQYPNETAIYYTFISYVLYSTVLCENMNNWSRWFRILRKNGGQKTCDAVPLNLRKKLPVLQGQRHEMF